MRRMHSLSRILTICSLLFITYTAMGQKSIAPNCKPPINRARWHDLVDKEQKNILKADGKADALFHVSEDEDVNYLVTRSVVQKVDALQCKIETDTAIYHNKKVGYLNSLQTVLKNFSSGFRNRSIHASNFPLIIDAYESAINRDKVGSSIESLVDKASYEVGNAVVSSGAFNNNPGYRPARYILLRKYTATRPDRILSMLTDNPDVPFRDSLILIAAYKDPQQLYNYAAANNKLGYAIRKIEDPLVKAISQIATSGGSGQLYFPFIDNIIQGKQSIKEIDAVKEDNLKYYKLLVKTRLDYLERMLTTKEKIYGMAALEQRMERKAKDYFVKTINGLHEEPDQVRFRILNGLTAQELYYIAVLSESDIYTSSYTRGVYPEIMKKIGNRGDSLLLSVNFDRYKKWIKLAAGFNTLSNFLGTFPDKDQASGLMTAFVNGLERSSGLEDGVDVADSYASIAETIKPLAAEMLENVRRNYQRNLADNNQRGIVIYNLLSKLFSSADSMNAIDLSKEFGIPPVYNVAYSSLANDSGSVIMQVFFYGDKDGKMYFQDFLSRFPSTVWKRTDNKQWVQFTSTKGKSLKVFANRPLPEENNQDAEAQEALNNFLSEKGLSPTVVVHRGHSYYAPYTIKQIKPSVKIAFLGSCGGYHLIHDVLAHAPDAHIISSKQIGKGSINQPFFDLLNEKLRAGNDVNWVPFWKEFKSRAGSVEGFEDYIPPHKNLGAIFIKAYNSQMGEDRNQL